MSKEMVENPLPPVKYKVFFGEGDRKFRFSTDANGEIYDHGGVIVVASFVDECKRIQYAASFCSPRDYFDKNFGRESALKRLIGTDNTDELYFSVIWDMYKKKNRWITFQILTDMLNKMETPSWAKKVVAANIKFIAPKLV